MRRRDFLGSLSIPLVTGIGGCLDSNPVFSEAITLGAVLLENHDPNASHQFDVRVKRDGRTVHDGSYRIKPRPPERIPTEFVDCTWEDERGEYSIAARIDGGRWGEYDVHDGAESESDCVVSSVQRIRWMEGNARPNFETFAICNQLDAGETHGAPCPRYQ